MRFDYVRRWENALVNRPAAETVPDHPTHRRFLEAEGARPLLLFFWAAVLGCLVGLVGAAFQASLIAVERWRHDFAASLEPGRVLWWLVPTVVSAALVFLALVLVRRVAPETS